MYFITFFSIIFEFFIVNLYFSKFSYRQASKPVFTLLCVIFIAFQFFCNNFLLAKSALILLGSFAFIFLCSLPYKMNFLSRIFSVVFIFSLAALSECIVAMLLTTIFEIKLEQTQSDLFLYVLCVLISKFTTLAVVLLLKFERKKKIDWLPSSLALNVLPLPFATFTVLILLFICCYNFSDFKFKILTFTSSLLLIISNVLVFYIIDKQNDYIRTKESLAFAEAHIKNQISHYSELYNYQNELRTFKHDSKNRLIALFGLIKTDETDKALQLIENDISFLNNSSQKIIDSGNPIIDAIIQTKLNYALNNGIIIKPVYKLSEPININSFELGVLIGNAIDNAIEATVKIDKKKRKPISINLLTAEGYLSFTCKNAVDKDIDTINLRSSKENKSEHGYGLNSIKSIVRKYNGEFFIDCENGWFNIKILLINDK